uniref:DUF148 domain-containing protein n=1 Tax=Strongyloides stercoralis TaxID=6248 RepID=A0A0K0E2D6_STRER
MHILLFIFFTIILSKVQYSWCERDLRCQQQMSHCMLYLTPNDPAFTKVILRVIQPLESLDLEFDIYGWEKNSRAIDRANQKVNKYVNRNEFMTVCKHLGILDKCSTSRELSIQFVSSLGGGNSIRDNGMRGGNSQMMRPGGMGGMGGHHGGNHMNEIGGMHRGMGGNGMGGHGMGGHGMGGRDMGMGMPMGMRGGNGMGYPNDRDRYMDRGMGHPQMSNHIMQGQHRMGK